MIIMIQIIMRTMITIIVKVKRVIGITIKKGYNIIIIIIKLRSSKNRKKVDHSIISYSNSSPLYII